MRLRRAVAVTVAGALAMAACGNSGGGSVEAFCEDTQKFVDIELPMNAGEYAGTLQEQKDAINAMVDDAPSDIIDDVKTVADILLSVIDALADVDPTDQEALDEIFADAEPDDPGAFAARDRVSEFVLAECGIDFDA